jgi:hypothetical protein
VRPALPGYCIIRKHLQIPFRHDVGRFFAASVEWNGGTRRGGFATALDLREVAGLVRYASGDATPDWARAVSGVLSYGAVIPLNIVGIAVWIRQKTPLLFLSRFLMDISG